jgi:ankyrin repeat protein
MGSPVILEKPYGAAMSGDWKNMIECYQDHFEYFFSAVSHSLDTVLHLAVHSNKKRPLKDLLGIVKEKESPLTEEEFLKLHNKFGNTVLHEATIYGNYEAVRLLVKRCPDLISIPNVYGETPLFTAAGSGEAEIVEFLIRFKPKNAWKIKTAFCQFTASDGKMTCPSLALLS